MIDPRIQMVYKFMFDSSFSNRHHRKDFSILYNKKEDVFEIDFITIFGNNFWIMLFDNYMRLRMFSSDGKNRVLDDWVKDYE